MREEEKKDFLAWRNFFLFQYKKKLFLQRKFRVVTFIKLYSHSTSQIFEYNLT
jgi:hypothetical protein